MGDKKFILLAEDNPDILEVLRLAVDQQFSEEIVQVKSGKEAITILNQRPNPICIISDHKMPDGDGKFLFQYTKEKNIHCPFIVCSVEDAKSLSPDYDGAYGLIDKFDLLTPLNSMLEEILKSVPNIAPSAEYSPVRLSVLLRLGFVNYDLYVKLSEKKYVKVAASETEFAIEDALKLMDKKIINLYLKRVDAQKLLEEFQKNITLLAQDASLPVEDMVGVSNEAYEMTRSLSQTFGWSQEVQDIASQGTRIAMNAIVKNAHLRKLLRNIGDSNDSYIATHSNILTYVCCGIARALEWTSEYTFTKLAMAALLHDITISREQELKIRQLNADAYDKNIKSEEVIKYRSHPAEAVILLNGIKDLPPDIDKIIQQHHELPDGSGFPGHLAQNRINSLAAVFIVAEDLVNHLLEKGDSRNIIEDFLSSRSERYSSGNFKKILGALAFSLQDSEEE